MGMRAARLLCALTALGLGLSGCSVTNCEQGAICLGEDDDGTGALCSQMCQRLVDCGRLQPYHRGDCFDACRDQLDDEDEGTEEYCECIVETSSCGKLDRECGHPPSFIPDIPNHEEDPIGSAPSCDASAPPTPERDAGTAPERDAGFERDASVESDASAHPEPDAGSGSCRVDDDCADSEGCRDCVCHLRCTASCQCRLGEVCEAGLCEPAPPATMSCATDCDCPAGNRCVELVCVSG